MGRPQRHKASTQFTLGGLSFVASASGRGGIGARPGTAGGRLYDPCNQPAPRNQCPNLATQLFSGRDAKGAVKAEVLRKAKDELLARVTSNETIKEEAARLVADDLAHSVHLRELILAASEQMKADSLRDAVRVMRAAAAYSTAIKNTSDIIRRSLRLEERDDPSDELPELVVTELTQAEIEKLRSKEEAES